MTVVVKLYNANRPCCTTNSNYWLLMNVVCNKFYVVFDYMNYEECMIFHIHCKMFYLNESVKYALTMLSSIKWHNFIPVDTLCTELNVRVWLVNTCSWKWNIIEKRIPFPSKPAFTFTRYSLLQLPKDCFTIAPTRNYRIQSMDEQN